MQLNALNITNFKNIAEARLEFSPKLNCFLGNNGMGKSNLLDAIYYLSFCKSFSGLPDKALIKQGEEFCTVRGIYVRKGTPEELSLGITAGHRKSFKRKGKEYSRLSEHIGLFPLVMVSPADNDLIAGTGEERRRLMDMVISQTDPIYLDHLIRYQRSLQQRNQMLRDHITDSALYMAIELPMATAASYITRRRIAWAQELACILEPTYGRIAASGEMPRIELRSHLTDDPNALTGLLESARRHDEIVGYTSVGPHRDDLDLMLNDMPVRRTASQGQCKTFTIALRLAQYEFLRRAVGFKPLLLLDDVFDKLDASRVERLIAIVSEDRFGQIFITDTNRDHLDNIVTHSGSDHCTWHVTSGIFSLLSSSQPL